MVSVGKNISFDVGQLRTVKKFMDDNNIKSWSSAVAILLKWGLEHFHYTSNDGVGVRQETLVEKRQKKAQLRGLNEYNK